MRAEPPRRPRARPYLNGMTSSDKPGIGSRTFAGLLVAQFTAAFNDQALHAAAMFFAINTGALADKDAIALLPVLFYAPWAAFCTLTGYVADRFSKRTVLLTWKWLELGICGLAAVGFWCGSAGELAGVWLVLGCVVLTGTHAAFFGPAKYALMPEILPPHQMSRGNGWLECLSFLAVILGTVSGGALSFVCRGDEWVIGVVLFALAAVGTACGYWIRPVPAAHPTRRFPRFVYVPIVGAVRDMWVSPRLRLALVGIALFTGIATFLRSTMYILGETRTPRWDELTTSAVVGTIAVGIGLGSPVAGHLSGPAVRVRFILFGGVGMAGACLLAGFATEVVAALVACIVAIGFFAGFYLVPLFTLLQQAGPKETKGVMVATSNFVDVFGAVLASALFYAVVSVVRASGVPPGDAPMWLLIAATSLIVLCLLWLRGAVKRAETSDR